MRLSLLACALGLLTPLSAGAAEPLDLADPTSRTIRIHFERSFGDPGAVARTFDEGWPAVWSVQGDVGRAEMSIATHEMSRESLHGLGLMAIPDTFLQFVVEVDLTTLEATSLATSGALTNGTQSFGFDTRVLDTTAVGGFVGPDTGPLFCTSQQQVDDFCLIDPIFCGQTCTLVPGSVYDPQTGTLNLIGPEEQLGCDGAACFGPFEMFATTGDLKLTESATPVPAASLSARMLLALLLVSGAALFSVRRQQRVLGRETDGPRSVRASSRGARHDRARYANHEATRSSGSASGRAFPCRVRGRDRGRRGRRAGRRSGDHLV